MARGDGIHRTNARNMRLTAAKIGNAQQHNEREKESYVNQDIVPERTRLNVHFKKPTTGYAEMFEQMKKDGTDFVWEDLRTIPRDELVSHFPNIIEHCKEMGYDVFKEPIPVVPAQHYFMGGVKVNHHSRTSMECLYAVGETACNGVHGRNRLASNSLLESLVFAKRAAGQMAELGFVNDEIAAKKAADSIDLADYSDEKAVEREYRKLAMEAIEGRTGAGTEETVESGIAYIQA